MGANGEYARGFVEAWNRRELQSYLDDVGSEFEWVIAREHPDAKTHRGPDAVAAYLGDWVATMPDLAVEIDEVVSTFRDGKPTRTEEFLDPNEARAGLAG